MLSFVRVTTGELWPKNCFKHASRSPFVRFLAFHAIIVWAGHVLSGHTWTIERVRYMQARLKAATSLLKTNCVYVEVGLSFSLST